MKITGRRRKGNAGGLFQLPVLPFLSIMLGLMSVMALVTLGLSVREFESKKQGQHSVELVGIPTNFTPFHIRCTDDGVKWLTADGIWKETQMLELLFLVRNLEAPATEPQFPEPGLLGHLQNKVRENRRLSFSRRQNTLILWVEPDGVDAATLVRIIISQFELPLRVGKLPIMENEVIHYDASSPK